MRNVFLSTMVFLGLLLGSCSKEDSVELENYNSTSVLDKGIESNEDLRNLDFEQIGIHHNEGLEYIYEQLNTHPVVLANGNNNVIYEFVFSKTDAYLNNTSYFNGFDNEILNKIKPNINNTTTEELTLDFKNEIEQKLNSSDSKVYFTNINEVFNEYANVEFYTSENAINNLRNIESNISYNANISTNEYVILRTMISTGIYSLQYWETNHHKWENLSTSTNQQAKNKVDWKWLKGAAKNMAIADAYGAGVGCIAGGIFAIWSGPGVVIGAAAGAVGMGMNGSAVAGVRELVKRLQ